MPWNRSPSLPSSLSWPGRLDPFRELNRIQSEVGRLLAPLSRAFSERDFPPVRVLTGDEGALLVALLPGVQPGEIDITVSGDSVCLKGSREGSSPTEETTWHRHERHTGRFARNLTLPFDVDSEQVEASFQNGVLEVRLPRVASQKPRRIPITTS